jgi:hypothetical protein
MSATPFPTAATLSDQITAAIPLGDSIRALTASVKADPSWRAQLRGLLSPLRTAFAQHRALTEGAHGIYAEVVHDAPRLARTVDDLVAEHRHLDEAMRRLAHVASDTDDTDGLRRRAMDVLDRLDRHRQHDSDLVHEAYSTDIGGE